MVSPHRVGWLCQRAEG